MFYAHLTFFHSKEHLTVMTRYRPIILEEEMKLGGITEESSDVDKLRWASKSHFWELALNIIRNGTNIHTVDKKAAIDNLIQNMFREFYPGKTFIRILDFCNEEQKQNVISNAKRMSYAGFDFLSVILPTVSSEEGSKLLEFMVEKSATAYVSDSMFAERTFPYCSKGQLEGIVPKLIDRNLWVCVAEALKLIGTSETENSIILLASEKAKNSEYIKHFVPLLTDNELRSDVIKILTKQIFH